MTRAMPDDAKGAERIFQEVLDRPDGERDRLVRERCGSDDAS